MEKVPVQIVLRPYASALPLASFAFGTGNILYSAFLLHWIPAAESMLLAVMLIAFVAPLELVPSIMAFLTRDGGGATAFGIFGAAWVVVGVQLLLHTPEHSDVTGVFLLCLALCLALIAVVTFPGKPLLGTVLVVAVMRTIADSVSVLSGSKALAMVSGYFGLVLAALAFYAAVAFLQEDVTQKISPLTFRFGAAKDAMEGRLEDQLSEITREAGVRKQL